MVLLSLLVPAYALAETAVSVDVSFAKGSGADTEGLSDGDYETYTTFQSGETLTVSSVGTPIGSLYVRWYTLPSPWTLSYTDANGQQHRQACGQNEFLHEYVPLEAGSTNCVLEFPSGAQACEISAYSAGDAPAGVQVWSPPCERADFMVCSTHADDEILWLGSVLATYAGEQGLPTQVVYMTNYWDGNMRREHEKLDGLWAIGVRNYPVNAPFSDVYADSLETAQEIYDQDAVTEFFTEQVRRFKPQVVVCQDFGGEYGHGGHQLLALAVQSAVDHAAEGNYYPLSARSFGTWNVPKTYYHLLEDNPIALEVNTPLERFGGMTAIEVQREAYKQHVTQQYTWFYVTDDPSDPNDDKFDCTRFGLYRSTVGPDTGNDMLEHITPYATQEAQEQAAAQARAEAEAAQAAAQQEEVTQEATATNDVESEPLLSILPFVLVGLLAVLIVLILIFVLRH